MKKLISSIRSDIHFYRYRPTARILASDIALIPDEKLALHIVEPCLLGWKVYNCCSELLFRKGLKSHIYPGPLV